jgi:ribosome biogenesis GTPase
VVLVFNKTDLLSPEELHYQEMMVTLYENIGYQCVAISAKELEEERGERKEEREKLEELLKDKITLFSGNSGVGKSTLLNKLIPGVELRTAEISDAHNTGMHTTTFSEMLRLPFGGWAIDTPGIKGFGTFDMEPEELSGYFRDIFHFAKDCRFSNCTHTHEPGCAVLKAVEDHYIAQSRYQSYLSMLEDKDEGKYREAF